MKLVLALLFLSSCTMSYEYRFGGPDEDNHEKHENGTSNK